MVLLRSRRHRDAVASESALRLQAALTRAPLVLREQSRPGVATVVEPEPAAEPEAVEQAGVVEQAAAVVAQARDWRPLAAGVGLVVLTALLGGGWYLWQARPQVAAAPAATSPALGAPVDPGGSPSSAATSGSGATTVGVPGSSVTPGGSSSAGGGAPGRSSSPGRASGTAAGLVVHIAGKVRRPGVLHLPAGSRVIDAVNAAGGLLPGVDPAGVNLARVLTDGEQLRIGLAVDPTVVGGTAGAGGGPAGGSSGAGGGSAGGGAGGSQALLDLNTATAQDLDTLPGVGPVLAERIVSWRTSHGSFKAVTDLRQVSGIGDRKFADISPRVRVG